MQLWKRSDTSGDIRKEDYGSVQRSRVLTVELQACSPSQSTVRVGVKQTEIASFISVRQVPDDYGAAVQSDIFKLHSFSKFRVHFLTKVFVGSGEILLALR